MPELEVRQVFGLKQRTKKTTVPKYLRTNSPLISDFSHAFANFINRDVIVVTLQAFNKNIKREREIELHTIFIVKK